MNRGRKAPGDPSGMRKQLGGCALLLAAGVAILGGLQCRTSALDALARDRWARAWIGALNSRSTDQVEPLLESVAGYTSSLTGRPLPPRAALHHIVALWRRFPHGRIETTAVSGNEHEVVIEWLAYPTGKGGDDPLPGITVLTISGNRIRWVESHYNAAALLRYFFPPRK